MNQHIFWQNDDDSITGYILDNETNTSGRSVLQIVLYKTTPNDDRYFYYYLDLVYLHMDSSLSVYTMIVAMGYLKQMHT